MNPIGDVKEEHQAVRRPLKFLDKKGGCHDH